MNVIIFGNDGWAIWKKTTIPTKIIWAKNNPIAVPKIAKLIHEEVQNSDLFGSKNMVIY